MGRLFTVRRAGFPPPQPGEPRVVAPDGSDSLEPAPPAADGLRRSRLASNTFRLALGQVGTTMLAIVFNAALARMLGASEFGLYFLLNSMVTSAYIIVEWGQPMLLVRETARDPRRAGALLGTGLILRLVGAAIVFLPLLLTACALRYGVSTVSTLALYFVATLPISLTQAFGAVFRAFDRMDLEPVVGVLNSAAGVVLILAALTCGGGLIAIGLCLLAAGIVSLLVAHRLYKRLDRAPLTWTRETARHLWQGGAAIMSLAAVQAAQPYLDVVILSKLVPPDAVGSFGAARLIMGTLLAPGVILATASFPQLSRAATSSDQLGAHVRDILRPMMLIGALGSAGTYLFARVAVQIVYGESHYARAVAILQVFSPVIFVLFVDILLGRALLAANRAKALAMIKVVSVAVSTVLDVILIPWFQAHHGNGGIGVVVAFGFSELVVFAGVMAIAPRGALHPRFAVEAAKTIAVAGGTILFVSGMTPGLHPAAAIPLTVIVFVALTLAFGLIRRADLALLSDMSRRRFGPGGGHTRTDE